MYSPCMKDLVFAIGPGTSIGVQKLTAQTPPKVFDPLLGQFVGDSGARQSTGDCYCDVALHVI